MRGNATPDGRRLIGTDLPFSGDATEVRTVLEAFKEALEVLPDLSLAIAGLRDRTLRVPIWHLVEDLGLQGHVSLYPYFDTLRNFPRFKDECDFWIERQHLGETFSARTLIEGVENGTGARKCALFFTMVHPGKNEGNSRLMRMWLDYIRSTGCRIHLVHYRYDRSAVTPAMRRRAQIEYDLYLEVEVESPLVGLNRCGSNIEVDDWSGPEILEAVAELTRTYAYDYAVVNYGFSSAVFERVQAYTRKILLTHDVFADRNTRMLLQGFKATGWASVEPQGEVIAAERSDIVVAIQKDEQQMLAEMLPAGTDVRLICPVVEAHAVEPRGRSGKLRIAFFGSPNGVNQSNLLDYIDALLERPGLPAQLEIVLAGGLCRDITRYVSQDKLDRVSARLFGEVTFLEQLFRECDIVVNPERGGTGIKIKSLETMAHGMPLLSTVAGASGLESQSRFHNAPDATSLAALTEEIVRNDSLLDVVRRDTVEAYARYKDLHYGSLAEIFGPAEDDHAASGLIKGWPPAARNIDVDLNGAAEVGATASEIDQFQDFARRIEIAGKRVLVLGSDPRLVAPILFAHNGAREVVVPVPAGIEVPISLRDRIIHAPEDLSGLDAAGGGFDIVYGTSVLQRAPILPRLAEVTLKALAPAGVGYLQGDPLWPAPAGTGVAGQEPAWSHLAEATTGADGGSNGASRTTTQRLTGPAAANTAQGGPGRFGNGLSSTEIERLFRQRFDLVARRQMTGQPANDFFEIARETYSPIDLRTEAIELWLRKPSRERAGAEGRMPTVSVIVPFYNVAPYLRECLSSVEEQTHGSFEVLLVNDGSQDDSLAIAEEFAQRDVRFRIIRHVANMGLGMARNSGVSEAVGDYLFFLDSDDRLASPTALSRILKSAVDTGSEVVAGSAQRLMTDGSLKPFDRQLEMDFGSGPDRVYRGAGAFNALIWVPGEGYLPLRAWGYLIDRRFYNRLAIEFPDGPHEDMGIVPLIACEANQVYYDPEIVVHYRMRDGSISRSHWSAAKTALFGRVWRHFRNAMPQFPSSGLVANAALSTTRHLVWGLERSGVQEKDRLAIRDEVGRILADVDDSADPALLGLTIELARKVFVRLGYSDAEISELLACLPIETVMSMHRRHLGLEETAR